MIRSNGESPAGDLLICNCATTDDCVRVATIAFSILDTEIVPSRDLGLVQ